MPQDPGGLRCRTLSMPSPPDILETAEYGSKGGRILQGGVHGCLGHDSGRSAIPHHFQRVGGCGGATLGISDGVGSGRAVRAQTRGHTLKFPLLRGKWHGLIVRPVMAPGSFQNIGRPVQRVGTEY